MEEWNRKLGEELKGKEINGKNFDEFVKEAIQIRLKYQIPFINRWNEVNFLIFCYSNNE
jgi:hypothetical protein